MARKNQAITVSQLLQECIKQIQKGNGKKHILISSDDEGNEYHELFFSFSPDLKGKDIEYGLPYGVSIESFDKEYIVLG